jgi:VWFA-related protein
MYGSRNLNLSRRELLALGAVLRPGIRVFAQDATFSADVKVVNVLVSVRNREGQAVRNVKQSDFKLEEDGKPQTIQYFSQQSDLALTLGLLVDTSGSQRYVLDEERKASLQFLRSVVREDRDKVFAVHFDAEVELLQDLTSSKRDLEAALSGPELQEGRVNRNRGGWGGGGRGRGPGRGGPPRMGMAGTALYDAVLLASDELMRKQPGRKALILLSDGVDQGSKVSLDHAVEAAQRADTLVYSILFSGTPAGPPLRIVWGPNGGGTPPIASQGRGRANGARVLQRISRETGGAYFEVSSKTPLHQIYARIEEELRSQYNLGYSPGNGKPGYRKIKVTVLQKGLTAQAREGYYAD